MSTPTYIQYDSRQNQTGCSAQESDERAQVEDQFTGRVGYDTIMLHVVSTIVVALGPAEVRKRLSRVHSGKAREEVSKPRARYRCVPDGLILNVSLPLWLHGSNVHTLALGEVLEALRQISVALGVPVTEVTQARLYRVDLAANLRLALSVSRYLPALVYVPRARRNSYEGSGLSFINKTRALVFYDKIRQLSKSGQAVPSALETQDVLRYELQSKRSLTHLLAPVLSLPPVAADLASPTVFRFLIGEWQTRFESVKTCRPSALGEPAGIQALNRSLARQGVGAIGAPEVIGALDALYEAKTFSSDMRSRMRRHVLELAAEGSPGAPDVAGDLAAAVQAAARTTTNQIH